MEREREVGGDGEVGGGEGEMIGEERGRGEVVGERGIGSSSIGTSIDVLREEISIEGVVSSDSDMFIEGVVSSDSGMSIEGVVSIDPISIEGVVTEEVGVSKASEKLDDKLKSEKSSSFVGVAEVGGAFFDLIAKCW